MQENETWTRLHRDVRECVRDGQNPAWTGPRRRWIQIPGWRRTSTCVTTSICRILFTIDYCWFVEFIHCCFTPCLQFLTDGTSVLKAKNYCRNPIDLEKPFCIVNDPSNPRQFCKVPDCEDQTREDSIFQCYFLPMLQCYAFQFIDGFLMPCQNLSAPSGSTCSIVESVTCSIIFELHIISHYYYSKQIGAHPMSG